jgi:glycosyltransferase involved in cell wall biosynthesis
MSALVSICIPTYQGSRWVMDAIASARRQDHPSLEIVIVDDASTDGTAELVATIDDPRIRIHRNPRNLGLVGNWDRCLELARGEYVKFLFQDDELRPDCVSRMLAIMERSEDVGLVFSRRRIVLDDPEDPGSRAWRDRFAVLDTAFGPLGSLEHRLWLVEGLLAHPSIRADAGLRRLRRRVLARMVVAGFRGTLHRRGSAGIRLRGLADYARFRATRSPVPLHAPLALEP